MLARLSFARILVAAMGFGWLLYIWAFRAGFLTLAVDDSWYYLTIARHLSQGYGPTFDRLEATDGFHPLWMIVLAGMQWLLGPFLQPAWMKVILTLQFFFLLGLLVGLTPVAVALGTRRATHCWLSVLLVSNFLTVKVFVNGQESALQAVLLVVVLLQYQRWIALPGLDCGGRPGWRELSGLGVAGGVLFLARLDGVFLVAGLVAIVVAKNREGRSEGKDLLWLVVGTLPLPLGYLCWHFVEFGHLQTVSGAIKAADATVLDYLICASLFGLVAGVLLWLAKSYKTVLLLYPLLCHVSGIQLYHSLIQEAPALQLPGRLETLLVGFLWIARPGPIWTLAPHLLLCLLLGGSLLTLARESMGRNGYRVLVVTGSGAFLLLSFSMWWIRFWPDTYSAYEARLEAAEWLARETPEKAIVAGWDIGIVGALSQRRVINLEGLAGSWRYKEHYLERRRLQDFVTSQGVTYIAQHLASRPRSAGFVAADLDLGDWYVEFARPYHFRFLVKPWKTVSATMFVLARRQRRGEPTLDSWWEAPGAASETGRRGQGRLNF